MARTETNNLHLNMYGDGDNAGAGATNSSAPTNTGLNGNWVKLDNVISPIITAGGVLQSGVVTTASIADGAVTNTKLGNVSIMRNKLNIDAVDTSNFDFNLNQQLKIKDSGIGGTQLQDNAITNLKIADNSIMAGKINADAIETNTMNMNVDGRIQVKSLGIGTTQLADAAVVAWKLADDAVVSQKIANGSVTSDKILDSAVITSKINTGAVTESKISVDNTRTKVNFIFTKNTATGTGYFGVGNVTGSSDVGIMMLRAGSITGIYAMTGTGTLSNTALKGVHTFTIGDKLQVYVSGIQGEGIPPYTISTRLNGGAVDKLTISNNSIGATATMIVNVEVEYD